MFAAGMLCRHNNNNDNRQTCARNGLLESICGCLSKHDQTSTVIENCLLALAALLQQSSSPTEEKELEERLLPFDNFSRDALVKRLCVDLNGCRLVPRLLLLLLLLLT